MHCGQRQSVSRVVYRSRAFRKHRWPEWSRQRVAKSGKWRKEKDMKFSFDAVEQGHVKSFGRYHTYILRRGTHEAFTVNSRWHKLLGPNLAAPARSDAIWYGHGLGPKLIAPATFVSIEGTCKLPSGVAFCDMFWHPSHCAVRLGNLWL